MTDIIYTYYDLDDHQWHRQEVSRLEINHTNSFDGQEKLALTLTLDNGCEIYEGPLKIDTPLQKSAPKSDLEGTKI